MVEDRSRRRALCLPSMSNEKGHGPVVMVGARLRLTLSTVQRVDRSLLFMFKHMRM